MQVESRPNFYDFSPRVIPYQSEVVDLLDSWDFSTGTPEILLSGSYGSAKSILMAHLTVRHCLEFAGARACLARKAMPDLKDTIFKEILEHISDDFVEGEDYWINQTSAKITFKNGSEIISRSWADKKYKKGRSLKLSMLVFEELTENTAEDKAAFDTLKARLRRLPHVPENILIAATNPDDPSHWVYRYWFDDKKPFKFVFKSVTTDNPFLDPVYINQLASTMTPREAERYLRGGWVELFKDKPYYNYRSESVFKPDVEYIFNRSFPVDVMHDFNIGAGKPMSCAVGQHINGHFHIAKVYAIEGARTLSICEELFNDGMYSKGSFVRVFGDATGRHNDTRGHRSDWDIIEKFIVNAGFKVQMKVPSVNPPVRTRHNTVNAFFMNSLNQRFVTIYKGAQKADTGFRLTNFKKGSAFDEDDSLPEQHVTTAIGYWMQYVKMDVAPQSISIT